VTDTLDSLIADLERQVKSGSKKGRAKTFKQVVDLYFSSIDLQEDQHVDFFGDVFGLLVDHVDTADLADLGHRIAPVDRAPAKLIRRLANDDDIAVAAPVIAQSGRLTSDDLVMLAQTKGQSHLRAISSRDRIDSAVTTVLVERADREVIKNVAKNAGAEFSIDGFARLAQRTLQDEDLAEAVGGRADIPAGVLRALVSQAAETVCARMLATASPELKAEIAASIGTRPSNKHDCAKARRLASELNRSGQLGEREIIEFADSGRVDETLAVLELLCATPADVIHRFMVQIPAEAMPVVCKAAGLSWAAAQAVLRLSGAIGGGLNESAQRKALANYAKLTRSTSEKLLRFWFVRGSNRADRRNGEPEEILVERRRRQQRKEVEMAASVLVDGKQVADTTVEDLSMQGAKLRLSSPCKLPDQFVLRLSANGNIYRRCVVRWRTRDHVGVQFTSESRTHSGLTPSS
jgi:uncharacterized protein (DUF2336 family)